MQYTISKAGDILFGNQRQKLEWCNAVWNRVNIPKHRMIAWLTVLGKLKTKEKLWKMKVIPDKLCLICGDHDESIGHLYFECRYSSEIIQNVKEWANWQTKKAGLLELMAWIRKKKRVTTVWRSVSWAILTSCVYQIWKMRNEALWHQKVWRIGMVMQYIKQEVQNRLQICFFFKKKKIYCK